MSLGCNAFNNSLMPLLAGLYSHTSLSTTKFIAACNEVGITQVPDLNTRNGTLGVSKVYTLI